MSNLVETLRATAPHYQCTKLLNEAADLIEQLQARIAELEQREQELAATVERLREDLKAILGWRELRDTKNIPIERIEEIAREAIEAADKQNLNAVKRASFIAGYTAGNGYPPSDWEADQYIKSIKEGE